MSKLPFILTEAGYQIFRARSRSILLLCVSALLCGCMTFYIGNITSAQSALESLSQTDPVTVRVVNVNGTRTRDLMITAKRLDKVRALPVHDLDATSQAFLMSGQDRLNVLGLSRFEAGGFAGEDAVSFAKGYDAGIFATDEPVCIVTEDCAQRCGLELGSTLSLPLYQVVYNAAGDRVERQITAGHEDAGKEESPEPYMATMTVAGIAGASRDKYLQADIYTPLETLRRMEAPNERSQTPFYCNTMRFKLDDSMDLTHMKDAMGEIGFFHPTDPSEGGSGASIGKADGCTLIFEDEHFIKTAERLGEKRKQFMDFIIPFFLVVILLVTLAILLVLRGARREMALSVSLGRPKLMVGLSNLLASLAAELAGCLIALPAAVMLVAPGVALAVCGAFMLCALMGDVAGLIGLLRFDTLRLLTETE